MAHCPRGCLWGERPHCTYLPSDAVSARMSDTAGLPHKKVKRKELEHEEARDARKKRRKEERRARREAEQATSTTSSWHTPDKIKAHKADAGTRSTEEQMKEERKRRKKEKKRKERKALAEMAAKKQSSSPLKDNAAVPKEGIELAPAVPIVRFESKTTTMTPEKQKKKKKKERPHEQMSSSNVVPTPEKGKAKEVIASEASTKHSETPKKKKKKNNNNDAGQKASNGSVQLPSLSREKTASQTGLQEDVIQVIPRHEGNEKTQKKKRKKVKASEKAVNAIVEQQETAAKKSVASGYQSHSSAKTMGQPSEPAEKRRKEVRRPPVGAALVPKATTSASFNMSTLQAKDLHKSSKENRKKKKAAKEKETQVNDGLRRDATLMTAMKTNDKDTTGSGTNKRNISTMIDDALKKSSSRGSNMIANSQAIPSQRESKGGGDDDNPSSEGNLTTKEGVLADAALLSHKEMLTDRLYRGHQLTWLKEERGLKVKQGKFSNWEIEMVRKAIADFQTEQGLSDEDFLTWLFSSTAERGEKGLYTSFWRRLTASVEDRPNRGLRLMVRRMLKPREAGAWTDEEQERLAKAIEKFGQRWPAVAKAVGGRTAEDCRLRWRDYNSQSAAVKKSGPFSEEEKEKLREAVRAACIEADIEDASAPSAAIPWKRVSEKLHGERNPNVYSMKWQEMQSQQAKQSSMAEASEGQEAWTDGDTTILLERLSQEQRALEHDDFTEVTLSKLRSPDWMADIKAMRRIWMQLVRSYTTSTNYKTNFRVNLDTIKDALATGQTARKRRRTPKDEEEDLIDTDEEE